MIKRVYLDTGQMIEAIPSKDEVPAFVALDTAGLRELVNGSIVIFKSSFGFEAIPTARIVRVVYSEDEQNG